MYIYACPASLSPSRSQIKLRGWLALLHLGDSEATDTVIALALHILTRYLAALAKAGQLRPAPAPRPAAAPSGSLSCVGGAEQPLVSDAGGASSPASVGGGSCERAAAGGCSTPSDPLWTRPATAAAAAAAAASPPSSTSSGYFAPAPFPPAAARLKAAEVAACLWAAIKLEERQALVPSSGTVASVAAVGSRSLLDAELKVMGRLEWRPLEGWMMHRKATAMS